jgi:hypothetical protein
VPSRHGDVVFPRLQTSERADNFTGLIAYARCAIDYGGVAGSLGERRSACVAGKSTRNRARNQEVLPHALGGQLIGSIQCQNKAIKMMMGMGTPRNHNSSERMTFSGQKKEEGRARLIPLCFRKNGKRRRLRRDGQ